MSTAVIRTAEDAEMLVNEGGNQRGNGGEWMGVKEEARTCRNEAFRHQNERTDAVF